jgi:N-methylhydantoinase A
LAVDIGGTFTDLVLVDYESGQLLARKILTTPTDPSQGVIAGVRWILDRHSIPASDVSQCVHATTLVTNALIERKGARVGLLTTQGFRDILEIGRELRYDLHDLFIEMPPPLVQRSMRLEVRERVLSNGKLLHPADEDGVRQAVRKLTAAGAEAVAIVFLHSYVNHANEQAVEAIISEENVDVFTSASYRVAPEIREYERTMTTVANAYVQPIVSRYIGDLELELRRLGLSGPLSLMNSSGGLSSAETARALPISLIESGPAAGALAAGFFGKLSGRRSVVAFDMGGTTAKACIVDDGVPLVAYTCEAGRINRFKRGSGLPLKVAAVDLVEVGAGGGSIASVNSLGLLKVGPKSAGAQPGPACYGLGGQDATVTDADLLLGYLRPDYFLGGEMRLDVDAAEAAVARIASVLRKGVIEIALGIHEIVTENMASATRTHIAERGRDPRNFALVATGGAGPVHACRLAKKLQLSQVLCPLGSGVASSVGLLVAPPRLDLAQAYIATLDAIDWGRVNAMYARMEKDAGEFLRRLGVADNGISMRALADIRYVGQGFEVLTELPPGPYAAHSIAEFAAAFESTYRALNERTELGLEIEAVTWRLRATGMSRDPERVGTALRDEHPSTRDGALPQNRRQAWFPELSGFVATPVYDRYSLTPGDSFRGPAIVEERESTVVVGPGTRFHIDEYCTLIMEFDRPTGLA